jgi:AAA15 family ATPase/GTPase
MNIQIKNLGPMKQAEFSLGDLTIICGKNNTGKTYATYALYGFLSLWREVISFPINDSISEQLLNDGVVHINIFDYFKNIEQILFNCCREYTKKLPTVFATSEDRFKETEFQVQIDPKDISLVEPYYERIGSEKTEVLSITKNEGSNDLLITLLFKIGNLKIKRFPILTDLTIKLALNEIFFGNLFPNTFIASAERTGAAIFRKELDFARNRLLKEISNTDKNIDARELLSKNYQNYAMPVEKNVDFTRRLETVSKRNSFISESHPELLSEFADIIGGEYSVNKYDELFYIPKGKHIKLTMDESSSAVRSLLDIGFYLRHVAKPGDLLMIDEPELNLHPENQCLVARLFARLVNLGIKVFITTHSDYIIKELNTLIMLNHDKPHLKQIAQKEGYKQQELLSSDKVKVYIAQEDLVLLNGYARKTKCQTLVPADINSELGIEAPSFDETIDKMNRIQEEIVYGGE